MKILKSTSNLVVCRKGDVGGGWFDQSGLSTFYENDMRYNLDDARQHIEELSVDLPKQGFEIILVTETQTLIETIEAYE